MYSTELILIALIALGGFYWWSAQAAKAVAYATARKRCDELGVLLLDESMVLRKLRMRRNGRGAMCLLRSYEFEFTSTGNDRYQGEIQVLGRRVLRTDMEPHRILH